MNLFLEERLEHDGWKLVWVKFRAWIPRLDLLVETPTEQVHEARRMPRSRYGMKALGLAADGELSISIGDQKISKPAAKRAQEVTRLCEELQHAHRRDGREPTSRGVAAADKVGGSQAGLRPESVHL